MTSRNCQPKWLKELRASLETMAELSKMTPAQKRAAGPAAGELPRRARADLAPDDLPCVDCGDEVFATEHRHEYDHVRGYDGANQLYVEPVCSKCHHNREEARHGRAA